MRSILVPEATALVLALSGLFASSQEHEHGVSPEQLGTVDFETSCGPAVRTPMNRAVALLHSFEFGAAIAGFEAVARDEPSCGIASWGIALASWGNPFAAGQKQPNQIRKGQAAVDGANRAGAGSERERLYIAAVAELYRDPEQRDQRTRVLAYRDAMAALASRHPEDMEASIFYALGAARGAELAGDRTAAADYYRQLLRSCEGADDPGRAELVVARRLVSGTTSRR
jgi:hypothetical protein